MTLQEGEAQDYQLFVDESTHVVMDFSRAGNGKG